MIERCPLVADSEKLYIQGEIPPKCATCLGRAAARLHEGRVGEELGILVGADEKKSLVLKGLSGNFYKVPGKSRESLLECNTTYTLADSSETSQVVARRKVTTRDGEELKILWRQRKNSLGFKSAEKMGIMIRSLAGKEFMCEEFAQRFIEDFIIGMAEENLLSNAALVMRGIDDILEILVSGERNRSMIKLVLKDVMRDEGSGIPEIVEKIIAKRSTGVSWKQKDKYPLPYNWMDL